MRTIGNGIPFTGAEYDKELNKGLYYEQGFLVATLLFDYDEFEYHSCYLHTEEDKDMFYDEMTTAKNDWEYEYKMSDGYGN